MTSSSRERILLLSRTTGGHRTVGNNDSKPPVFRQLTPAEFARLSSSMQLTILTIRRAQLSSRKAIAAAAEWKKQRGDG